MGYLTLPSGFAPIGTVASNNLMNSNDTERLIQVSSYTKKKEILLGTPCKGAIRIKFDLRLSVVGDTAYARIYRNDVAIGIVRSENTGVYTTFSEDFTIDWAKNDLIQIYAYVGGTGNGGYIKNFRFYYDFLLDISNQDP